MPPILFDESTATGRSFDLGICFIFLLQNREYSSSLKVIFSPEEISKCMARHNPIASAHRQSSCGALNQYLSTQNDEGAGVQFQWVECLYESPWDQIPIVVPYHHLKSRNSPVITRLYAAPQTGDSAYIPRWQKWISAIATASAPVPIIRIPP